MNAAVERKTVVPHDQRVLLPLHAAMIMEMLRQALQISEQGAAFVLAPSDEPLEVSGRREKRLAPGFGMDAHRRMAVFEFVFGEVMAFAQPQPLFACQLC